MRKCMLFVFVVLLVSGCSRAGGGGYTAGDIRGYNHTQQGINHFTVNGYGGGVRGNTCCILLPDKWTPELKAHVEWEVDINPYIVLPPLGTDAFRRAYAKHEASYQKHSMVVDIPQYGKERCGITVHFLPCNQVKVTTICDGYGTPNYPIKEPLEMKEPAQCPK
ncbi:hypothetical protein WB66_22800 [bacteria symbiont BFo1 of Frankliniella occidentalis]|uniref:DUF3304 domain-containing protein n=1 Tax=Erwinia aphidicola TaxID=68334 RepID=UPI0006645AD6|nr:DUF3304 domain-containing protein [uncultured Erwinia sp.]KMV67867.1 hypothetical protein AI28_05110 [bacteria symbiont BFo1 of Frankliniella occidentalis]KYP82515.1 hypothetical protein WB66_22800 [bacteria symbiont BFo1 of Frankliniella occidentalis]